MEEARVPGENHQSVSSHCQTLSHNVVSSTPRHDAGFELTTLVLIALIAHVQLPYDHDQDAPVSH